MPPGATALGHLHEDETATLVLSGRARPRYGEGAESGAVASHAASPNLDLRVTRACPSACSRRLLGTTRASTDAELRTPASPGWNQACTRGPPALVLVVRSGRLVVVRAD